MAENVEQIEARLCEYIDGALDAGERAEIEKHLAANPAHMQLVLELMSQKGLLRQLPREKAPADLAEPLQGAFEREALLSPDPAIESQMVLRPSRWPQLLSAAAVLFLAAGLGTIVYFVLPPKNPVVSLAPAPRSAATAPEAMAAPVAQPQDANDASRQKDAQGLTFATKDPDKEVKQEPATSDVDKLARADSTDKRKSLGSEEPPARPEGADAAIIARGAAFFGGDNGNQVLLITVKAADVKRANEQVVQYLASNNLAWSPLDNPPAAPGAPAQTPTAMPTTAPTGAIAVASAAPSQSEGQPGATGGGGFGGAGAFGGRDDASPAGARSFGALAKRESLAVDRTRGFSSASAGPLPELVGLAEGNKAELAGPAILVRNLNGQQVTELAASLSQPQRQQWAMVQREPMATAKLALEQQIALPERDIRTPEEERIGVLTPTVPATRPATGLLVTPESTLNIETPAVAAPPAPAPALAPATQPVAAAGGGLGLATTNGLEDRILAARAAANEYNCVIVFENTTVAPTTQPAESASPATQPATQPAAPPENAPAIQPVAQ